ncbi:hypothetical protein [Alloscardovia criceti]|uniref:hypothetical protein n=1 Tax=Alloscardovia criceti TaxID=356828 RepID=UPI0003612E30|nr:hypothetical protein [Alloscardovia criceti]
MAAQRKRSKKLARKFLIRRIVALLALVGIVVLAVWGVRYFAASSHADPSSSTSASSQDTSAEDAQNSSESSGNFRSEKAQDSGIPDCSASDVDMKLIEDQSSLYSGNTMTFTKDFTHKGDTDCLLDTSDDAMVIVISNDQGVQIWRSDACSVDSADILLSQTDNYQKVTTWNGTVSNTAVDDSISSRAQVNANGHGCMNEGEAAPVAAAGDYTAELINSADDTMKSDAVKFSIL